ncbi:CASP-like protein 5A1 isoform X2 [Populus nigra]|uniref:CASP-like protein 5A1 isoform X2 n=1 Tax=Populus nigra TaxID=3691 RepID=UPI002B270776|nr:CASP-like protein 5A1 isoform X2 [Populus nigra]
MSSVSRPTVHPVEAPPLTDGPQNALIRVRMKDVQGMPGTRGSLSLRLTQFVFGLVSICVMATTSDFRSVTAFRYLVSAVSVQILWSLSMAVVDIYALLVRRSLRKQIIFRLFTIGDGISNCYCYGLYQLFCHDAVLSLELLVPGFPIRNL